MVATFTAVVSNDCPDAGGIVTKPKPKVIHSIKEFRDTYWTPELRRAMEEAAQPTQTIVIIPRKP